MISRRRFLTGVAIALAPIGAAAHAQEYKAQQPGNVARIGFIWSSSPSTVTELVEALRQGLRELGYIEGQNIALERAMGRGAP